MLEILRKKEFVYCEYYTSKPPQYLHYFDRKVACFNPQVYIETSRKERLEPHNNRERR